MDHAATVRRFYDFINAGDLDGFGALLSGDFVEHEETPGLSPTKEGVLTFFRMQLAAFPDLHMEAHDVFASGDKVTARVTLTGTNRGDFMGMKATGKRLSSRKHQANNNGRLRCHSAKASIASRSWMVLASRKTCCW